MSHVIPLWLVQTLNLYRWNCNVCGLSRKMTKLNYVRNLGGVASMTRVGAAANDQAFCSAPCMANMRTTMIELLRAWNSHEYATFFPDFTYTSVRTMLMGR